MKIAAAVEYCGSHFHGWQRLKNDRSVQQCIEEALSKVANQTINVSCAGRTDAGVHARYQIIHFETDSPRKMHSWVFGANANLPSDVSLLWAKLVEDDFHARFLATARTYTYVILNRSARPALHHPLLTWERRPLDVSLMSRAAAHLLGKHDFTSFRAQACQSQSPVREIYELTVERHDKYVMVNVRANAFLYHMVRNIAGVLIAIGSGNKEADWARQVLQAKDRARAGVTAPPTGLYLVNVEYPERFELPLAEVSSFPLPG
ncbi:MAG: tRNA pseudouridine38-40 synthase [Gammaproteobacteria bacterium]|jgi:tRNA pseudouridine38-40 synthase